jgi:hypothetical protein
MSESRIYDRCRSSMAERERSNRCVSCSSSVFFLLLFFSGESEQILVVPLCDTVHKYLHAPSYFHSTAGAVLIVLRREQCCSLDNTSADG